MSFKPFLGFGCGLRPDHYSTFLQSPPTKSIDWVEIIAENYLDHEDGRTPRAMESLEKIRETFPVVAHGVTLSLGSTDPLDLKHLERIKRLLDRTEAVWFSDHLCWTGVGGATLHDLYPLPYTEEAIQIVSENILRTQDFLGRTMLIENVSSYITYQASTIPEWEFIGEILQRTGCGILLDVNNVYVSSRNHGFDPLDYLRNIPVDRIGQIHLAGHSNEGNHLIDTHDEKVCAPVWELYRWVVQNLGTFTTLVEWDDKIPPWPVLEQEVATARSLGETPHGRRYESQRPSATL